MPRMSGKTILAALVVLFLLTPFIESMPNGDLVEAIAITVVLVAGVGATGGNPRAMAGAALLAIPAVIGRWLHYLAPGLVHPGVYLAVAVMAMVYITLRFVVYVMRAERVTSDVLCTGLSAFLMIALLWAFGYIMVDRLVPGSFLYTVGPVHEMTGFVALYFSLVTQCTVGFGDIVPVSNAARTLAMFQGAVGVIFIAVMLARLVSLYSAEKAQAGY